MAKRENLSLIVVGREEALVHSFFSSFSLAPLPFPHSPSSCTLAKRDDGPYQEREQAHPDPSLWHVYLEYMNSRAGLLCSSLAKIGMSLATKLLERPFTHCICIQYIELRIITFHQKMENRYLLIKSHVKTEIQFVHLGTCL